VEDLGAVVKTALTTSLKDVEVEIVRRLNSLSSPTTANIRKLRREFSKRVAVLPGTSVIKLGLQLLNRNEFLLRFFAYELIQHHPSASLNLNSRNLTLLGEGIDSWSAVDTFACYLSGPSWRKRQIPDSLIAKWSRSKDRCWRRAAVVSTVPLNNKARGGTGDAARTLQICRLAIEDRNDMVVKALSWALRELSKRDPEAVAKFVSENQTRLSPRVLREVRNKLTTGLKNPKTLRD
jgi:3-methyladenine DNA glycosylase AlkD